MSRHIIDKPKAFDPTKRTAMFLRMERTLGRSEASKLAQKRSVPLRSGRLREFLRIERGQRA